MGRIRTSDPQMPLISNYSLMLCQLSYPRVVLDRLRIYNLEPQRSTC
jgi:hypothetical protein